MSSDAAKFRRILGVWDLTSLGIGGIVGGGIFVITGMAAAQYAGPGIIFSFLLAGTAAGIIALVYAELAVHIPLAGPTYVHVAQTLGTFPGWIVGWLMLLIMALATIGFFVPPRKAVRATRSMGYNARSIEVPGCRAGSYRSSL